MPPEPSAIVTLWPLTDSRAIQVRARIRGRAVPADLEVHVRAGAVAGAAHLADLLAGLDVLAHGDVALGQVGVARGVAAGVLDTDHLAVAALLAGDADGAAVGRADGRAGRHGDVGAAVGVVAAVLAVVAGDRAALHRGDDPAVGRAAVAGRRDRRRLRRRRARRVGCRSSLSGADSGAAGRGRVAGDLVLELDAVGEIGAADGVRRGRLGRRARGATVVGGRARGARRRPVAIEQHLGLEQRGPGLGVDDAGHREPLPTLPTLDGLLGLRPEDPVLDDLQLVLDGLHRIAGVAVGEQRGLVVADGGLLGDLGLRHAGPRRAGQRRRAARARGRRGLAAPAASVTPFWRGAFRRARRARSPPALRPVQ